jgi:predicted alpha-1,2-mannosidase
MPFTGNPKVVPGTAENPDECYRSRFSHKSEKAEPGFYSVLLEDYEIKAELTATTRAGMHRYTFPANDKTGLIIDLAHTIYPDRNPNHEFKIINNTEIAGYKGSGGWAEEQHTWFYAKFNKPFTCVFYDNGKEIKNTETVKSKHLLAVLTFDTKNDKELLAKVGISHVDYDGALKNLEAEIKDWDFNLVRESSKQLWANELNQIQVQGGTEDEKTIFYTSLYHTAISPYTFSDVDGRYRGMDQKIHNAGGQTIYTVFSLWDTFRGNHPLKTIIDPERNNEFVKTLLTKYDQGGALPMWELVANYTGCMIGYHSVPVIVDAYQKGIRDFDIEKAYQAMVEAASYKTDGILFPSDGVQQKLMPKSKLYNEEIGFVPCDLENQSVSKALEYAYNDWCIAQMAKELGKTEDYTRFMKRSKNYTEYYDKNTGFMRGKTSDGKWREPFNPRSSEHRVDDYTEGNAFQWSWFVPHDVEGYIELVGGKQQFIDKLDTLFSTSSELVGDHVSSDITGLIGQYAHGNEPSHHITHMYNFVGQSWKTQELTNQIMSELYFNDPNGLAGNEDCGQMSAWYVLNAMGFYSFCPGDQNYSIGRPVFEKAEIKLSNGKVFTVIAKNNTSENKYIHSAKLNGNPILKPFFTHDDILNGGTLEFEMADSPNINLFN